MTTVQIAARVEAEQEAAFRRTAKQIGTTPADALRVFIAAFIREGGYPFRPRADPEMDWLDQARADWGEW